MLTLSTEDVCIIHQLTEYASFDLNIPNVCFGNAAICNLAKMIFRSYRVANLYPPRR